MYICDWYKNNFLTANKDKFQTLCLASKARNTQEAQTMKKLNWSSLTLSVGVLIDINLALVHTFNKSVRKQIAKLLSSRE